MTTPYAPDAPNAPSPPRTLDGRYIVVRGRLWRASDPALTPAERERLVGELMNARRAVRAASGDPEATAQARACVDAAKRGLGERGPVWWDDEAPDYNRYLVKNMPYAKWYAELDPDDPRQEAPRGRKR